MSHKEIKIADELWSRWYTGSSKVESEKLGPRAGFLHLTEEANQSRGVVNRIHLPATPIISIIIVW
jgi:hypothetical protein